MASPQEVKVTVSARFGYEDDFTFEKKKEDLAQLVRSDIAPRILQMLGAKSAKVSIDADGDIGVQIKDVGYIYLNSRGVTYSATNIALSLISTSSLVRSLPDVITELHQLRSGYLEPVSYAARIFFTFWYPSEPSVNNLRSQFFFPLLQFSEGTITSLSGNLSYSGREFRDTLEVETKTEQVTARFMRDADAVEFADFADFWAKAKVGEVATKLLPFLQPLDRTENLSSLGKLLGGTASEK